MGKRTSYAPGTFSWADLGTTDAEGAKSFYGRLLGWRGEDMPAGEGMVYTMLRLDGDDVAALYAMQQTEQPPAWLSYITVEDIEVSAQRAGELGATVMTGPLDVLDAGRMVLLSDPQGAVVALWQARGHVGASRVNDPGCMGWNQLTTTDVEGAERFYGDLLGWTMERDPGDDSSYAIIRNGTAMNGGLMALTPEMASAGVPPHWDVFFTVADLEASLATTTDAGGSVLVPPMSAGPGQFAVVADPQGAAFCLYAGEVDD